MDTYLFLGYIIPLGLIIFAFWMVSKKQGPLKILGIAILVIVILLFLLGNFGTGEGGMVRGLL